VKALASITTSGPLYANRVLVLGLVNFGIQSGLFGVQLWLSQIEQAMGFSNRENGFVVALPFAVGMAAMILWGSIQR
jgi:hypothetical protein